ncbi:hypothetical protein EHS25_000004 [Saitozyma podzolica]|uniref:Uncharacterized protein n=1 Tax=Saitozyma podzolica TaxID=1890683 RepID=A0A427YUW1_9TREE|nr:hypothetical protein EHS25_000004 [Saitozyma podzolica]
MSLLKLFWQAAGLSLYGVKAIGLAGDVSDYAQVESAVHETVKLLGRLDCAVNAAAIPGAHRVTGEYPIEHWWKLSSINLDGVFFCVKAQLNHFVQSGTQGTIVNVSSIHGFLAKAGDPAYVASKHAVIGLTKSAALEYGKHGIRVNAICPGFVKTPFIISSGGSMEQFEQAGAVAPLGRCATADEIGRSIAFLLSEDASFITGSVLTADGGYTLSGQTLHM